MFLSEKLSTLKLQEGIVKKFEREAIASKILEAPKPPQVINNKIDILFFTLCSV